MGTGYTYQCKKCLKTGSLTIGAGMLWYDFENVKSALHWQFRRQLEEFEKVNGSSSKDYSLNLYTCPKCKTIHSKFWVRATSQDGKIFETIFKCPKCKRKLEEVDEEEFDNANYACQNCGQFELEYITESIWD